MARIRKPGRPNVVDAPDRVDLLIAKRLKQRREFMEITQEELAERSNISRQQMAKYEQGINRIAASRLHQLALILRTDMNFFVDMDRAPQEKPETQPIDERKLLDAYRGLPPLGKARALRLVRMAS